MKVYTYYDPTVQKCGLPPQDGVVRLWAESWAKHGWEPRILTERVVRMHPLYKSFKAAVNKFPTTNAPQYEEACYLRWLALKGAGGGWMTDYDVINFGFKPRPGKGMVEMLDPTYVPCAVWTSLRGIAKVVNMIREHNPASEKHVSDMLIFKTRFGGREFGTPGTECVEYGVEGWKKSPLVHFAAGKTTGFPSKVEAIQSSLSAHA